MSEAVATAKALGYIGGARFSTSIPSDAVILFESIDGTFTKFEMPKQAQIKEMHLISPLYASGNLTHEGEKIEYVCQAFPVPQKDMKLSKYPKLVSDDIKAKIFDIACTCVPQVFARMHEESKVVDKQSTDFWGFPYSLTYTFNISAGENGSNTTS